MEKLWCSGCWLITTTAILYVVAVICNVFYAWFDFAGFSGYEKWGKDSSGKAWFNIFVFIAIPFALSMVLFYNRMKPLLDNEAFLMLFGFLVVTLGAIGWSFFHFLFQKTRGKLVSILLLYLPGVLIGLLVVRLLINLPIFPLHWRLIFLPGAVLSFLSLFRAAKGLYKAIVRSIAICSLPYQT